MNPRWRIIGIVAGFAAVTLGLFAIVSRVDGEPRGAPERPDLYSTYTSLAWPCGPSVPEWNGKPADPHDALEGRWLSDDDIHAALDGVSPGPSTTEWTTDRLAGLRIWVGALRGAYNWVVDTAGPSLASGPLTPAQERERATTLADATARFHRALALTAAEISSGTPADWGDMERPTARLCDGIYTGR